MPIVKNSTYNPPKILKSGHLQTLYPYFFRKVRDVKCSRKRLFTLDNDFIDVDNLFKEEELLSVQSGNFFFVFFEILSIIPILKEVLNNPQGTIINHSKILSLQMTTLMHRYYKLLPKDLNLSRYKRPNINCSHAPSQFLRLFQREITRPGLILKASFVA